MAIALRDIKVAALRYFIDKLVVVISEPVAAVPSTINPDEEFSFGVTVTNPSSDNGGVGIKLKCLRLWVEAPPAGAPRDLPKIKYTPLAGLKFRYSANPMSTEYTSGVFSDIFLHPDSGQPWSMYPGTTRTFAGIAGKAGPSGGAGPLGRFLIRAVAVGQIDLDYLFDPLASTYPPAVQDANVM